jgi:hypothetical protein
MGAKLRAQEVPTLPGRRDLQRSWLPGQAVRLDLATGRVVLGRSVLVSDSLIVLRVRSGSRPTSFAREELRRVRLQTGSKTVTGMVVGAGLAGGLVATSFLVSGEGFAPSGEYAGVGILLSVLAMLPGGVVGALVGGQVPAYQAYDPHRDR